MASLESKVFQQHTTSLERLCGFAMVRAGTCHPSELTVLNPEDIDMLLPDRSQFTHLLFATVVCSFVVVVVVVVVVMVVAAVAAAVAVVVVVVVAAPARLWSSGGGRRRPRPTSSVLVFVFVFVFVFIFVFVFVVVMSSSSSSFRLLNVVVVVVVVAATVQTAANSVELSNWLWALTSFLEAPNRPLSNRKKWSFPAPCAPRALPFEPPGPNSRPTTHCLRQSCLWEAVGFPLSAEWRELLYHRGENAAGTTTCALSKLFFLAKAIFQISLPPRRSCAAACILPRSITDTRSGAKVGQLPSKPLRSRLFSPAKAACRPGQQRT